MSPPLDWLSRLLEIAPVRGELDLRCMYGAPWRIDQSASAPGEIPYHVVLGGSAVLEDPAGGAPHQLATGDIVLLADGDAHTLHDGSGKRAKRSHERAVANLVFSENAGNGARLDMLCGRFVLSPTHARLLREYLPTRLIAHSAVQTGDATSTGMHLSNLLALMRVESGGESLGGRAMLNALSTALFALTLRFASESGEAPEGLLALAGYPRLAPALDAMLHHPDQAWTLPALAQLCNMSRATFVRLFQEKLGRSASDLLTDIRMTMAANELRTSAASTGAIAEQVGYQSEAAFQRAFKLHMGVTPAGWRREAQ
ncbi:AraC family transcriptional regulator [Dyella acidisoli]|uniref:Transcriptional regulator n=1 Tax=Dyella acidisoli TaxID=1867834 RepID=A0ABQ5XU29_9GAMM|nr:AraC family transcriptional regulator [Dyella acidisoli]GLQ94981.1 transcriptional regulator [Dyella acidisoli]